MFRCLIDGRPLTLLLRRSARGWLAHFRNIFTPRFFTWIRQYNLKFLLADLLSALVITSIVIPQALAYAVRCAPRCCSSVVVMRVALRAYCARDGERETFGV